MESVHYQEVQPERDVSGDNFTKGQINFNFTMDSRGYWNPYKTYFRFRIKMTKDGTEQLDDASNAAPSQFLCDNFFQQIQVYLNNRCISEIGDFVPQVAALKNRLYRTDEDMVKSLSVTNMSSPNWYDRQAMVVNTTGGRTVHKDFDGRTTNSAFNNVAVPGYKIIECIWKPPLGLFDFNGYLPSAGGMWNFRFTPQPSAILNKYAFEAKPDTDIQSTNISIETLQCYVLKGIGPALTNKSYSMSVKEIRCQTQNLTTPNNTQKTFQVHPRTEALTIAYQHPQAGVDQLHAATKFTSNGSERNLTRFYLKFGGKQLPTPIPDMKLTDTEENFVQRYTESIQYSKLDTIVFSPEPFQKWLARGPYYHFAGYGNFEKESDRCYVSQQFSAFNPVGAPVNPNVLLFDHFTKKINISISNSQLNSVIVDGDEYS